MKYINWLEGLNKGLKIVLAIIPLAHLFWIVYMFIRDIPTKHILVVALDIIFGVAPLGIVCYILNIISVIRHGKAIDLKELFNLK